MHIFKYFRAIKARRWVIVPMRVSVLGIAAVLLTKSSCGNKRPRSTQYTGGNVAHNHCAHVRTSTPMCKRQLSLSRRRGRGHKSDPDSALIAHHLNPSHIPLSSSLLVCLSSTMSFVRTSPQTAAALCLRTESIPQAGDVAGVGHSRRGYSNAVRCLFMAQAVYLGMGWGWGRGGGSWGGQAERESMEARVKRHRSPFRRSALNFLNVLI